MVRIEYINGDVETVEALEEYSFYAYKPEALKDNERLKQMIEGFTSMMGGFLGKGRREELIADFMKQDAAILQIMGGEINNSNKV